MRDSKAQLLVDQLNPILKHSKHFINHLEIDYDNEEICYVNRFQAILYRLHYPELTVTEALYEIADYLMGG